MATIAEALMTSVNPTVGSTLLERYGPIAIVVVWLLATLALMFGLAPTSDASTLAYGTLSGAAGIWIAHMGSDE